MEGGGGGAGRRAERPWMASAPVGEPGSAQGPKGQHRARKAPLPLTPGTARWHGSHRVRKVAWRRRSGQGSGSLRLTAAGPWTRPLSVPRGRHLSPGPQRHCKHFPVLRPPAGGVSKRGGEGEDMTLKLSAGWCWESLAWVHAPPPRPPWLHQASNSSSTPF